MRISSLLFVLAVTSSCDGCPVVPVAEGEGEGEVAEGEGEGEAAEGEGEAAEGEGEAAEGEGEAAEGEGEGEAAEGEGEAAEGEGETAEGEGEGEAAEGEGEAAEGEGEGEGEDGHGSGDVFVEITYEQATAPERPTFTYSDTPGFGPNEWAYNDPFGGGMGSPDAWDRFNTMSIINDFRLGTVLAIGTGNHELQLMLGLPAAVSYDTVLVEVDGDETASAGVTRYDVFNPLVGCGLFSDDAAVTDGIGRHTKVLDIGPCLVPGESVQAIRLDPQAGELGLKRMRVTLVNASW
jgi:hypothetical protein